MSLLRWTLLGKLDNPFWEGQILLDRGQPDLGDPALPLFSLLPRKANLPQIEGARLRLTLTHRSSHGKVLASLVPQQTIWYPAKPEGGWQRGMLAAKARLMLPSGKGMVSGSLLWFVGFALHRQAPLLLWQSVVHNMSSHAVTITRYAPLAVGPDKHNLPRRGLLDLFPARLRLFRLLSRPVKPSAYYNLTERFGSLRLSEAPHPLQATTLTRERGTWSPFPLPSTPAWTTASLTIQVLRLADQPQALLVATQEPHQAQWWVQDNPLAPGLRLVFHPQVNLPPHAVWQGTPVILGWHNPDTRLLLPDFLLPPSHLLSSSVG